ncbi:30S ribosomal protein S21, partial [Sulfitobacter sp. 1A12056]|uniref:small ribosomal subunit protein bS21 n=1 Tax=Sulfitobacter sp. 1A12056 TaxID=3368592 RepID=UPI0037470DD9
MQVSVRDNNVDQALRVLKKKLQSEGECPIFCVIAIWSMLPERSKDDDHIQ